MNYIIFDLEATCWEGRRDLPNETIEIGAVLVNDKMEIVNEFVQFIKPVIHPTLSEFCKELTTIQQEDVDQAPNFGEAIEKFKSWFNYESGDYCLCSWGFYDRTQLNNDSILHELDTAWLKNHISLKHQFAELKNLKRPCGMKGALDREGLSLEGTHHRGIDDARNISKIFLKNFGLWKIPS